MAGRTPLFASFIFVIVTGIASAQKAPRPAAAESGITAYLQFGATANSDGAIYDLNPSIGYDFNSHFGLALGAPIYFIRPAASTGSSAASGLGDPYLTFHLRYPNEMLNFATLLTGTAPVGNSKEGLSTGRATFDWTNRFDRTFSQVTPFLQAGFSNTTSDSRLFVRPYTTLGLNTHFRGGAEVNVWKSLSIGVAAYDILPFGNQTVFSRISKVPTGNGAGATHGRNFQVSQQTTGTADIARDNGFSTWLDASLTPYLDAELGYTHSAHYDLNSVSFSLGLNVGHLLRRSAHQ